MNPPKRTETGYNNRDPVTFIYFNARVNIRARATILTHKLCCAIFPPPRYITTISSTTNLTGSTPLRFTTVYTSANYAPHHCSSSSLLLLAVLAAHNATPLDSIALGSRPNWPSASRGARVNYTPINRLPVILSLLQSIYKNLHYNIMYMHWLYMYNLIKKTLHDLFSSNNICIVYRNTHCSV